MVLEFCFYIKAFYFGDFLEFMAKNSALEYKITKSDGIFRLFVKAKTAELENFINSQISQIPHSIFLENSEVFKREISSFNEQKNIFQKSNFKSENITPYCLKNGVNEFNARSDENFINSAITTLNNAQILRYKDLEICAFGDFACDYMVPVRVENIAKIFIADESALIALCSFEKPVLRLKTSALYRQNHKNAPRSFNLRLPWDLNIFKICQKLENIAFLGVKSKSEIFSVNLLNKAVLINSGFDFSPKKASSNNELIKLILAEKSLENKTSAVFNLSKTSDDFIRVFKNNECYEMLKITTPSSFDEIYKNINQNLLNNFKANFILKTGEIAANNSFYALFNIIKEILNFDDEILELSDDFNLQKGVRISYKLINKNELDVFGLISSAMSFRLAGASKQDIAFGIIESLAFFIGDMCDILRAELYCQGEILCGSLFSTKSLSRLCVLHTKATFSQIYPLEI